MAQSGRADRADRCPLLGEEQTFLGPTATSGFDPKRTWAAYFALKRNAVGAYQCDRLSSSAREGT